ncbi:MAG: cadherin-like beta sandwich domain-containing protein, partial [Actinomycetes bacterium]
MKKTNMTKTFKNSKLFKASSIFAALLMVLMPTTGVGSFASVAYAVTATEDTSLAVFTVDGQAVSNGSVVNVDYGTTSVDVVATPTVIGSDSADSATVDITGDTGLESGENTVTVVVTAADDVTTQTYLVTVDVAQNNDTSLGVFSVNGDDVVANGVVELAYGTTSVDVIAEPSDVEATVEIAGDSPLVTGDNALTITVTAANSSTIQAYTVTLRVAENGDATLGVFSVNGDDVTSGGTVNLDYGTTSVDVVAEPSDVEATVEIAGDSPLVTGNNTLTVTVTAANGDTQSYSITLAVAKNNDATLGVFTVNGEDVADNATVNVDNGTTSVTIIADPSDPGASVQVTGNSSLKTGNNTVTVAVTAANLTTVVTYTLTIKVATAPGDEFSNDTTLSTFKVDGSTVVDNQTVNIAQGRTSVSVEVVTNDVLSTAVTAGNTNLQPGANDVTVTVTADDGTVKVYHINVVVAVPSSDVTLSSVKINGSTFSGDLDGTGVYNALFGTTAVTVVASTSSNTAIATVTGTTDLDPGENLVSIHVVAENGATADYSFKVVVAAANTNTNLSTFKVNGSSVTDNQVIELAYGTTGVSVEAVTSADTSTFTVSGADSLTTGDRTLTVAVRAQSGTTVNHSVTLRVLAASSNKTITGITVNGETVYGTLKAVPAGTTTATILVDLESPVATYTVSGNGTVVAGDNQFTITVTAQDRSTTQKTITVYVPTISTDKSLASITVDDVVVAV